MLIEVILMMDWAVDQVGCVAWFNILTFQDVVIHICRVADSRRVRESRVHHEGRRWMRWSASYVRKW